MLPNKAKIPISPTPSPYARDLRYYAVTVFSIAVASQKAPEKPHSSPGARAGAPPASRATSAPCSVQRPAHGAAARPTRDTAHTARPTRDPLRRFTDSHASQDPRSP